MLKDIHASYSEVLRDIAKQDGILTNQKQLLDYDFETFNQKAAFLLSRG